jgi:flavin-binding protein dodecin
MVREAASKSEAAALDAVDRAEAALARRRADWSRAKEVGGQVVQSLGHMGRTTVSGVAEFNGALGRYGKGALTDTIDIGRKSIASKDFGEVVDLFVDYISHRSRTLFASI